jgi:rhamnosyltransferase
MYKEFNKAYRYRVAAYITAYCDLLAINKCLESLFAQTYPLEKIIIIDNSPVALDLSIEPQFQDKVIVKPYPDNIGISQGLCIGIEWAIGNNYDFLWTFDQDSEPSSDSLEKLLFKYDELNSDHSPIGIIAPLSMDIPSGQELEGAIFDKYRFLPVSKYKKNNVEQNKKQGFYECDMVITSGSLVNLKAAKNIELPNPDLFIDAVDWDYCMKFRSQGYRIIVTTQALMHHNFGSFVKNRIKRDKKLSPVYSYSVMRYYYMFRNHTFMQTRLSREYNSLHLSCVHRIQFLVKIIARIMLYEPNDKFAKLWACYRGTFDGFLGKLGKTWHP